MIPRGGVLIRAAMKQVPARDITRGRRCETTKSLSGLPLGAAGTAAVMLERCNDYLKLPISRGSAVPLPKTG